MHPRRKPGDTHTREAAEGDALTMALCDICAQVDCSCGARDQATCPHTGEWRSWPDRITVEDLKTGNHGTICVDCGKDLTLEETLVVLVNEESTLGTK